jgi:hypothetical protein
LFLPGKILDRPEYFCFWAGASIVCSSNLKKLRGGMAGSFIYSCHRERSEAIQLSSWRWIALPSARNDDDLR